MRFPRLHSDVEFNTSAKHARPLVLSNTTPQSSNTESDVADALSCSGNWRGFLSEAAHSSAAIDSRDTNPVHELIQPIRPPTPSPWPVCYRHKETHEAAWLIKPRVQELVPAQPVEEEPQERVRTLRLLPQ